MVREGENQTRKNRETIVFAAILVDAVATGRLNTILLFELEVLFDFNDREYGTQNVYFCFQFVCCRVALIWATIDQLYRKKKQRCDGPMN